MWEPGVEMLTSRCESVAKGRKVARGSSRGAGMLCEWVATGGTTKWMVKV